MTGCKPRTRQRASTSHSRNGCSTCKLRRVKCGEERPGCLRCSKSGWQCDGYDSTQAKHVSPAPHHPRGPGPSSLNSSSRVPNLEELEYRYFQNYLEQTSTSLDLQDSTSFFWKRVVLQESYSNPCVRHALVAIGAVAKGAHARLRWGYIINISDSARERHREFALIQYQKAIRGLRSFIEGVQKGKGARTTLISCMVLTLFDCFYGNVGFAAQHIRFGRRLLSAWKSNDLNNNPQSPSMEDPIDDQLIRMFVGLDMQAICFLDSDKEHTYRSSLPLWPAQPTVLNEFQTLSEATSVRQQILLDGHNFYLRTLQHKFSPTEDVPMDMIHQREYYISQINLWNSYMEGLLRETSMGRMLHPLSRAPALRLYTSILLIRLSSTLNAPESVYDNLLEHFEYLLSIAKEVIQFEAHNTTIPLGKYPLTLTVAAESNTIIGVNIESFTFEVRIIPALYLVATKCRNSVIRHEAINLLKSSHRREGLWDSLLSAKVCEWMVALEEQGLGNSKALIEEVVIPENRRVFAETIDLDVQGRNAVVKCRQNREGMGSTERSTVVCW